MAFPPLGAAGRSLPCSGLCFLSLSPGSGSGGMGMVDTEWAVLAWVSMPLQVSWRPVGTPGAKTHKGPESLRLLWGWDSFHMKMMMTSSLWSHPAAGGVGWGTGSPAYSASGSLRHLPGSVCSACTAVSCFLLVMRPN